MAEEAAAGGEGGGEGGPATTAATEESTDLGFYNRKLHNYPLIKVCTCTIVRVASVTSSFSFPVVL